MNNFSNWDRVIVFTEDATRGQEWVKAVNYISQFFLRCKEKNSGWITAECAHAESIRPNWFARMNDSGDSDAAWAYREALLKHISFAVQDNCKHVLYVCEGVKIGSGFDGEFSKFHSELPVDFMGYQLAGFESCKPAPLKDGGVCARNCGASGTMMFGLSTKGLRRVYEHLLWHPTKTVDDAFQLLFTQEPHFYRPIKLFVPPDHSFKRKLAICSSALPSATDVPRTGDELIARIEKIHFENHINVVGDIFVEPSSSERRAISMGLFAPKGEWAGRSYIVGALENCRLARFYYPGWEVKIYVDDTITEQVRGMLRRGGATVVRAAYPGMFGRFGIALDDSVDRFIVRDADSRLGPREVVAVNEWIASGRAWHVIKDYRDRMVDPRPIPGGCFGLVRKRGIEHMEAVLQKARPGYVIDERALREIFPSISVDTYVNASQMLHVYNDPHPLTKHNPDGRHVGARYCR